MEETTHNKKQRDFMVPASILVAGVLIGFSIIASNSGWFKSGGNSGGTIQNGGDLGSAADVLKIGERDVIMGDPKAPITVVEYADFQCPFCGRFYETTGKEIREQYVKSGKVKMIYRDLAFLGPESLAAAEAAECSKDQKSFWAFHDALYDAEIKDGAENNGNLNKDLFVKLAKQVGISDIDAFSSCIDSKKYENEVKAIGTGATALQVNSTPTLFIGQTKIVGAQPIGVFKTEIEKQLSAQ
jgi:protein-disulfide isomerase